MTLYWFSPTAGRIIALYRNPTDDVYTTVCTDMCRSPAYLLEVGVKYATRSGGRWSLVLAEGRMLWVAEGVLSVLDKIE